MSSAPKTDATSKSTQPEQPAKDRDFAEKMDACKSYEEKMELYWADYEEDPDYWEGDEDCVA